MINTIQFKKCDPSDFEHFYRLRCEENNICWTGWDAPPNYEHLQKWFLSNLMRHDRTIFLAYETCYKLTYGYLYIDRVAKQVFAISYAVSDKYRNNGIGTKIIQFATTYVLQNLQPNSKIIAKVAENNIASISALLKNNYPPTNEWEMGFFRKSGLSVKMQFYEYKK